MSKALLEELLKLTPAERLDLIGELWDSIPEADHPPLTEAQKQEIDRRIAEHERDPSSAIPWEQVREQLRLRFK